MSLKSVIIAICLFLAVGTITVSAQNETKPNSGQTDSEQYKKALELLAKQGIFGRFSSTEKEADEGFKIVAVRRLNVWMNSPYDRLPQNRTLKELVEIELYAAFLPIASSLGEVVQIGTRTFPPRYSTCENYTNCLKVIMTIKEFNDLKDNSLVTLYKGPRWNSETLEERYKNGEPKEVLGAKFGRLNKKMIDDYPTVEINAPR